MPIKILEIPFNYEVTHVPPRARNERHASVRDSVGVAVRVLDEALFPVAMRMQDRDAGQYDQVDDIRTDGIGLYRPCTYEPRGERHYISPEVLDEPGVPSRFTNPFGHCIRDDWRMRDPVPRRDIPGRIVRDGHNTAAATIARRASELVVCGDKVFERCGEPYYRHHAGSGRYEYFSVETASEDGTLEDPVSAVRADRLDPWRARLGDRFHVTGTIEVLMPEVLRLKVSELALLDVTDTVVGSLANHAAGATIDEFRVYADLRDALAACKKKVTENLVEAVDTLLESGLHEDVHGMGVLKDKRREFREDLLAEPAPARAPALR